MTARRKNLLLVVCSLGASLAICELIARVVAKGDAAAERAAFIEAVSPGQLAPGSPAVTRGDGSVSYRIHPYFGYTFNPNPPNIGPQGFAKSAGTLYPKAPGEFVIGIFGGSVAGQVSGWGKILVKRLLPVVQKRGYQRVTVLSYAVGGWRQPQSFHALLPVLPALDLVVNVDGVNELAELDPLNLPNQPADFPAPYIFNPLAHDLGEETTMRHAELFSRMSSARSTTRVFGAPPLRWSRLAHLVWRVWSKRARKKIDALREEEQRSDHLDWSNYEPARTPAEIEAVRDRYMIRWFDLIRYSRLICESRGVPFFDFIQPNQHPAGRKPLSKEERAMMDASPVKPTFYTPFYVRLEQAEKTLRGEGIEYHFLGDLFKDHAETLYIDACCHLNDSGIEMLNNAIADRILASGRLEKLSPKR
jgi:hypothetical protein